MVGLAMAILFLANFANTSPRGTTMTTMNVSIPEALREYVDERITEGGYANVSDYIRALIRDDRTRQAKARIEEKLLEGLASGPGVKATEAHWEGLKAKVRDRIRKAAK